MSWTSESEPQSHTIDERDASAAGPSDGDADPSDGDADPSDGDADPSDVDADPSDGDVVPTSADSPSGGRNGDSGIDDDGPLDPSLFFGLFDDLGDVDKTGHGVDASELTDATESDGTGTGTIDSDPAASDTADDVDESDHADAGPVRIGGITIVEHDPVTTLEEQGVDEREPDAAPVDESGSDATEDAVANDSLFGVLEELLEGEPADGSDDTPADGEPAPSDADDDSDVVILGAGVPLAATTPSESGSGPTQPVALNEDIADERGFDGPEVGATDGGDEPVDVAVTVEPMIESGIRQPVVSPPKVFSATSGSPTSVPAGVDEPQPPAGDRVSVAGPGRGVVLAAVLFTSVVVVLVAVAIRSGDDEPRTEAADGNNPVASADAGDIAVDEARIESDADSAAPADTGAQDVAATGEQASQAVAALARELAEGRVDLTSIRFVPGTTEPTEASGRLIKELADAVLASDGRPVSVVVRTYSEAGPGDNQALSEAQAAALVDLLAAEGVPRDQLVATGLGSGPLSPQQPVPDFVVVNPELGDAVFKQVIADIGTFTLGSRPGGYESDRSSDTLRLESLAIVDGVGQALLNFEDSTIGLAGYSYFEADNESNRARAGQVSDAVARRLSDVHGIGPDRVTIITPGAAPYVVTPEIGSHVWIRAGARTNTAFAVAGIDTSAIEFDMGSATPSAASGAVLDELAAALAGSTDTLVIDVRTYSEPSGAADMELSQARADAIAAYLVETGGVEAGRIRAFGSGASSYFTDDGGSHVTLTVIP